MSTDAKASVTSFTLPSRHFVKNDVLCSQLLRDKNTPSFTLSHPPRFSLSILAVSAPLPWGMPRRSVFSEGRGERG
jgi:hypothetical protein